MGKPKLCMCPKIHKPVCGSDGKTYGNSCMAKCKKVDFKEGACSTKCMCAEIYKPVCGSDGKTYGNSCTAKCKKVDFKEGACSSIGKCEKLNYKECEKASCSWDGGECKTKGGRAPCSTVKNIDNFCGKDKAFLVANSDSLCAGTQCTKEKDR